MYFVWLVLIWHDSRFLFFCSNRMYLRVCSSHLWRRQQLQPGLEEFPVWLSYRQLQSTLTGLFLMRRQTASSGGSTEMTGCLDPGEKKSRSQIGTVKNQTLRCLWSVLTLPASKSRRSTSRPCPSPENQATAPGRCGWRLCGRCSEMRSWAEGRGRTATEMTPHWRWQIKTILADC